MQIKNANVYTENKQFVKRDIWIEDGFFADPTAKTAGEVIDAEGYYAIPGLIDLHFHGCMGYDFCDGTLEAIIEIAKYQAAIGVTTMAPATMTLPIAELERILKVGAEFAQTESPGANLAGVNMEGPFISTVKKGAQDDRHILPCSAEIYRRFQEAANGLVKFIGLAPEESDYAQLISAAGKDANVALAHSNASYEIAKKAFDEGANHVVHLYNAMPPFNHRQPGIVGAAFDSPHVTAELICDGVHIHPAVVRATFKMLGEDRIILISDCMRATGLADGQYTLGGQAVSVKGNRATLVSNGALAGSATNLMDCVRIAVKDMNIPLETAIGCATINPAKKLGIFDQYGSISKGKRANLVLLDKELNLVRVIKSN